jgi:hypothetical protein
MGVFKSLGKKGNKLKKRNKKRKLARIKNEKKTQSLNGDAKSKLDYWFGSGEITQEEYDRYLEELEHDMV